MILDQLKMGEHQAKWRALVSRNEETERMFNPCSSHSWKNAQTPSVMFFRLDVLIFCQGIRKYCFFSFFSENLDKWWMNGHPVILRGCQICVLIAFHAIFRPTLDYRCCAISSRELSAIFYDPLRKKIPSWYETSVWWYCLKWARNVQRRWKVCANHTQLWYWRDFTELATCLMISLLCSIKQRK